MAGEPGSGKSALARAVGQETGAVMLDKDVIKTAALRAEAEESLAGRIAYEAFFDMAESLLAQGLSVVLDSPSYFETIPAKGQAIAARHHVRYHFVECVCDDPAELARRLANRSRLESQPGAIETRERSTVGPAGAYLRIDMRQPVERCLALVIEYLGHDPRQDLRR